jgi:hypothetical protein
VAIGVAAHCEASFWSAGRCVAEDGVANAALERALLWPAEERADGRTAFRGGGAEIVMRCRS